MTVKVNINNDPMALVPMSFIWPKHPFIDKPQVCDANRESLLPPSLTPESVEPRALWYPDGTLVFRSSLNDYYLAPLDAFAPRLLILPEVYYKPGIQLAAAYELYASSPHIPYADTPYAATVYFDCPNNKSSVEFPLANETPEGLVQMSAFIHIDYQNATKIDPDDWSWTWQSRLM